MESNAKFIDPEATLYKAGLTVGQTLVDLGAGSGFFSLAAAKIVGEQGKIFVVDILEKSLEHVASTARTKNYHNVKTLVADLEKDSLQSIDTGIADVVICVNLLHQIKNQADLMEKIYRLLKTGGKLVIIDWSGKHPIIGPKNAPIMTTDEIKSVVSYAHLRFESEIDAGSYHFGLLFKK